MFETFTVDRLVRFVLIAIAVYAVIAVLGFLFAERLIFQPPRSSYGPDAFPFARVPVGDDGSVAVLHLPNDDAHHTILFSHGNAEDVGSTLPVLRALRDLGFGVVAYDYRGYGQSAGGPPTAHKVVEDAETVYRYATNDLGIAPERLILYGFSLGSGPTLELATRHSAAGVILHSPFTSTYRVVTRVPLLPFDRFPNLARVRELRRPLLVIHGTRDLIVPAWHGRRLFAEAAEPKLSLWVEGAGHNNVLAVAGDDYAQALAKFADLLEPLAGGTIRHHDR